MDARKKTRQTLITRMTKKFDVIKETAVSLRKLNSSIPSTTTLKASLVKAMAASKDVVIYRLSKESEVLKRDLTAAKIKINELEPANKQLNSKLKIARRQNCKMTKRAKAKDNAKHDLMLSDSDNEQRQYDGFP